MMMYSEWNYQYDFNQKLKTEEKKIPVNRVFKRSLWEENSIFDALHKRKKKGWKKIIEKAWNGDDRLAATIGYSQTFQPWRVWYREFYLV